MFTKVLAKYYHQWFADCHESAIYCINKGNKIRAEQYLDDASKYLTIIMENWDMIEFFSINDNAFLVDSALPEQYRGIR
jgi:hypothetical protein